MPTKRSSTSPAGLWNACASMELAAASKLTADLRSFGAAFADCYESGVQVPTLPSDRREDDDLRVSALFLKRCLNDMRAVWMQTVAGYTSQAAAIAAALFEHALAVEALVGSPDNVMQLRKAKNGDLPWSPLELSKIHAANLRQEAQAIGAEYSEDDFAIAWREVYAAYKFLCKIKHPTIRSTLHDAPSASIHDAEYVVMAAPDLRPENLPVKATVLMIAVSRTYQAIRWFALNMDCDTSHVRCRDFMKRLSRVVPAAKQAYKELMVLPLPFDIAGEKVANEYFNLKKQRSELVS